ncbi:hypothetical protein [Staphylococcus lugdunensis]|nr:hypothetical protein [Staphylococcus lugdunensis]MCH8651198.1 hypothetical protein [Staphylococcus lugdunensis]
MPKLIIPILLIIGLLINVIPNIYKKNMGIVVTDIIIAIVILLLNLY